MYLYVLIDDSRGFHDEMIFMACVNWGAEFRSL